jgi:D-alanyl-D-alanine carboxypeptidase/D-alanyl-D-alanine carboxypeptidase (penicillin-binding protein 5/6)
MRVFTERRVRHVFAVLFMAAAVSLGAGAAMAPSWAVLDADSGVFLGEDGGNHVQPPASLAKMMTLYLTFEALHDGRLHWNDRITVSRKASAKIPMKLWIKPGSTISVREAVDGMIVISANDAAAAIGEHLAGSEAAFGRLMTKRGRQLGLKNTIFTNPSGLSDGHRQTTTARDMARLGRALQRDFPREYKRFSQASFVYRGKRLRGHNNLMYRYDGVDGIKTGFTNLAGYNIVSSLNSGGRHLIGVVLGGRTARTRDDRMAALLTRFGSKGAAQPLIAMRVPLPTPRPLEDVAMDDSLIEQGDGGVVPAISAWKIQIAALPSAGAARALLDKVSALAGFARAGLTASVEPVVAGGKKLYRARFDGFEDQTAAGKACAALKQRKFDCITVEAP